MTSRRSRLFARIQETHISSRKVHVDVRYMKISGTCGCTCRCTCTGRCKLHVDLHVDVDIDVDMM